ncbi:MAG: hypothetical protein GWN01_05430 [Nitrosopumilaceae archaeon]|nr:hypothetical protein [Nitrosopumilaceae archaeon]NIU86787.1 hypothetical protein [Nitrosopumilaceae archaeon]NIX60987.1 hypothetical protein [Nitrosopumilaceae archaeon]
MNQADKWDIIESEYDLFKARMLRAENSFLSRIPRETHLELLDYIQTIHKPLYKLV